MDTRALNDTATALGIMPSWLNSLIQFESGWKPEARNPYSGARGLIQFTNTTAKGMGFQDADDLYNQFPTDTAQLRGPVLDYLKPMMPFPTEQSLYMAVFYPVARNWPLDTPFPDTVQKVNPGIVTVNDYVSKVRHSPLIKTGIDIAGILLIIGVSYFGYQYIIKPHLKEGVAWLKTAPKALTKQIVTVDPKKADQYPD